MHRTQRCHIMQVIANLILLIDSVRIRIQHWMHCTHHILTVCVGLGSFRSVSFRSQGSEQRPLMIDFYVAVHSTICLGANNFFIYTQKWILFYLQIKKKNKTWNFYHVMWFSIFSICVISLIKWIVKLKISY